MPRQEISDDVWSVMEPLMPEGRNVVERCFNRLKQWRGIAMRPDKLLRSYRAAVSLAATLIWIRSDLIDTAQE